MKISAKRYVSLLRTYVAPQWLKALLMVVFLLLSIGLQLLGPRLVGSFIDTLRNGVNSGLLLTLSITFIVIALVNQLVSVAVSYLSEYVAWTAANRLRHDLVAHTLSLDMSFHTTKTPGELIERIDGDVNQLANFFSLFIITLLSNLLLLLGILFLLFFIDWRLGLLVTTILIVSLWILLRIRNYSTPLWIHFRQKSAEFFGFLSEHLVGTEDIRANGAMQASMNQFYLLLRQWLPIRKKAIMLGTGTGVTTITLYTISIAISLAFGLFLWSQGSITIGTFYVIYAYIALLAIPLEQIQVQIQDLQQVDACIQRIEELLHTPSQLRVTSPSEEGQRTLPPGPLSLEFRHVSFAYTPDERILHDLKFFVQPGKILGILGHTGSGKTTIARLLFRLYDPQEGQICVQGLPIDMLPVREFRRHLGMVTQDVQLFHATLRDNLTFFNRTVADSQVVEALEQVGLHSWYQALPDGLETMLGSDGRGLSAGEAQLVAFARIFLANPQVVVLDEASSRLDYATERLIDQAVKKLFQQRTCIVIAHRLATLECADDILLLERGRVLEYGKRETLLKDPFSHFSQLLSLSQQKQTRQVSEEDIPFETIDCIKEERV